MNEAQSVVPSNVESRKPRQIPEDIGVLDVFWHPKDPQHPDQYEDASSYRLLHGKSRRDATLTLAVADGASEAVLSGTWSKILVDTFVNRPPKGGRSGFRTGWWEKAQKAFKEQLDISSLPWYAVDKLANGSLATFGGVAIFLSDHQFAIVGHGDVVIVLDREDGLDIYPRSLHTAEAFGNRPALVSTLEPPVIDGRIQNRHSLPRGGCTFLLMTDALGAWFVAEHTKSPDNALRQLNSFEDHAAFASFVEASRASKAMRTDDVTLVRLRLCPP